MALLHTISSVVRLPLRVAGKSVSTVTGLLPGVGAKSAPAPTDVKPPDVSGNAKPAAQAPAKKPAAKGQVQPTPSSGPTPDPAAPAAPRKAPAKKAAAPKATPAQKPAPAEASTAPAKTAPAKKAPASKAPAKKAPVKKAPAAKSAASLEPIGDSGTGIDAAADTDDVKVTPADIASSIGTQLAESTETTETPTEAPDTSGDRPPSPS